MMIDAQLQLASAQAVTASAPSSNYIDKGAAGELGLSYLAVMFTCVTSCVAAGAATVQFQILNAIDAAFTIPGIVIESDAIPKASLVAGYQLILPIPPGTDKEFIQAYFNVGTGPLTAGAFTVQLVRKSDIQKYSAIKAANYN